MKVKHCKAEYYVIKWDGADSPCWVRRRPYPQLATRFKGEHRKDHDGWLRFHQDMEVRSRKDRTRQGYIGGKRGWKNSFRAKGNVIRKAFPSNVESIFARRNLKQGKYGGPVHDAINRNSILRSVTGRGTAAPGTYNGRTDIHPVYRLSGVNDMSNLTGAELLTRKPPKYLGKGFLLLRGWACGSDDIMGNMSYIKFRVESYDIAKEKFDDLVTHPECSHVELSRWGDSEARILHSWYGER